MEIQFRPIQGLESDILKTGYHPGYVYFATDTKKIYLDANGQSKLPMGGNSGIYYGKMVLTETPDEGQKEFEFNIYDIEGNSEEDAPNIPNINDLILNLPDGCFYRVMEINGEILLTNKLTIAGTGGSTDGPTNAGGATMNREDSQSATILYQSDYSVAFSVTATDSSGESTGDGTYELYVNDFKKASGIARQGIINYVSVGEYLNLGENSIKIYAYMDTGGSSSTRLQKTWKITTTQLTLNWDYKETTVNSVENDLTLKWTITGGTGFKKSTRILIDDYYEITTEEQKIVIPRAQLKNYNLVHGAHKVEMQVIPEGLPPTPSIIKNIIMYEPNNTLPIISCGLFTTTLTQYNTVEIPIIIYIEGNTGGATLIGKEGEYEKYRQENCVNAKVYTWNYTPTIAGTQLITIQCGLSETVLTVYVEGLDIDNEEIPGYAFRLKASDLTNNTALKNWNSNGVTLSVSDRFDWTNGGLQSEKDEYGNKRQYVNIKAGSSLTIDYPLFAKTPKGDGKTLKFIFKAVNCRDYDATVLNCKRDKKIAKVISGEENKYYLPIFDKTSLNYGRAIYLDADGNGSLHDIQTAVFDRTDIESRNKFEGKYISFENMFYQCHFEKIDEEYQAFWYKVIIIDSFEGFVMNAQAAELNTDASTISTQYCEDTYIEFEFDIANLDENNNGLRNYIKFWIDGVPCNYTIYGDNESFIDTTNQKIVIGSPDCDIYLYMIKVYEQTLTDEEHLTNFIADAPNAEEMLKRFRRNDIKYDDRDDIDYAKLAKANPNCLVHLYEIPRMTKNKKDPVPGCTYAQYQGSGVNAQLTANNVTIKVQGTSSEKYVDAAANIDSDFTEGFIDVATGNHLDGWSMDGGTALPINYTCTKVNVASCENANNALNQEWYNLFQPYQTVLRCKNPRARDTMQFTNGVMFIKDLNDTFTLAPGADTKANNLFGDTPNYMSSRYHKMYSIANMGNSKDNIHVFHDESNPKECCIEVKDNQAPQQWMVSDNYNKGDIGEKEKYFEFRYPDGADNASQEMKDGWNRFVTWMAHSNPSAKYLEHDIQSESEFEIISINLKTMKPVPVYVMNAEKTAYNKVTAYDPNVHTYYTETEHIHGYTNLLLESEVTFEPYVFRGYRTDLKDDNGNLWQKDYTPLIAGCTEDAYAGTYKYDTFEYRMAKMLSECEDYLVMDSVLYHYLFIERHCMIDNVAKNTFWSTEDCQHWNLTKDYDNDTADGNDNNGKFTRTYGMETTDMLNEVKYVFNAHQSVWLNFIQNLTNACEHMYQELEKVEKTINNRKVSVWNKNDYLWLFTEWQSIIPERCWIEDYWRKYMRPYEVYGIVMFNGMIEGGQKKYQRKQFETYQSMYISSKYFGSECRSNYIWIRPTGSDLLDYPIPAKLYQDCYIHAEVGQQYSKQRVKRNEWANFTIPVNNLNEATMSLHPSSAISVLGRIGEGGGELGALHPDIFQTFNAHKLRELIFSTKSSLGSNNSNFKEGLGLSQNELLEKLYLANFTAYTEGLDLSACNNLVELDASNSTFTEVKLADNAPTKVVLLSAPTILVMSNLFDVNTFNINDYGLLKTVNLNNVDYNAIDTKYIVDSAINLKNYNLINVNWSLSQAEEIDDTEKTISILERLLNDLMPLETAAGINPTNISLTGSLTIPEDVYNGYNSFDIYSKYAKPDIYPNLDINFIGDNAKLYNISILDGNNDVCWTRKIKPGDTLTKDFLSGGPQGDFNLGGIYKSPSVANEYIFQKTWKVYNASDLTTSIATIGDVDGYPVYAPINGITHDIVIIPDFESQLRQYTVYFYGANEEELGSVTTGYGTLLKDIAPTTIPYKDSSNLELKSAWDFIGYGLTKDATLPVSENFIIASQNQAFYALFDLIEDITTVVHEDYFDYWEDKYYEVNDPIGTVAGYRVAPKAGKTLQGKITIPSTYNNLPVVKIADFAQQKVTHIFMANNSKVCKINANTFQDLATLQYFDFSQKNIRHIGTLAFANCSLNEQCIASLGLSSNLLTVEEKGFNNAFKTSRYTTLKIPASVQTAGKLSFAYQNKFVGGGQIEIGSGDQLSNLILSANAGAFNQNTGNDNYIKIAWFYTKNYDSLDSAVISNFEGLSVTCASGSISS